MTEPVLVTKPVGSESRVKKIAIIGGIVLLALFVLPKLMGGGDSSNEADPFPPPSSVPTTVPAKRGDVETLGSYGTKNPFTPLVDDGDAAAAPAPAPAVGAPGPDFGPDIPITDGSGEFGEPGGLEPTPPMTPSPTTPTTAPPRPTHRLGLLEVYRADSGMAAARVRVDDSVMDTAVGEDFGGSYRTISLDRDSGCGVFLFGDQRLTLCEGQEAIT